MSYVLEKIDKEGRRRVDADAGSELARIMDKQHFWDVDGVEFDRHWVIDCGNGNYLMRSPRFFLQLSGDLYFFTFRSKLYRLRVKGSYDPMVDFYMGEKPPREQYEEFKRELTSAFAVHGERGTGPGNRALVPTFSEEV